MEYAIKTDIGRRAVNEDRARIPGLDESVPFVAVSDGMGGHAAGSVAASLVISGMEDELSRMYDADPVKVLRRAVTRVSLDVYRTAEDDPNLTGMGATLVCALLFGNRFIAGNVGDSRLYHFDGRTLTQVTRDHSYVQLLVDEGVLTKEEARCHPQRNIITRAMGHALRIEADIYDRTWQCGDILLLCSDGLCGSLQTDEMRTILSENAGLQELADRLVSAALAAGASDNVTLVLARCAGGACA